MGLLETLDKYKDQIIDATKLEEIKSSIRVMERTNNELEANNRALTEGKKLLQEEIQYLKKGKKESLRIIKDCEEQVEELEKRVAPKQKYSKNAEAILAYFLEEDKTKEYEVKLISFVQAKGFNEIQIQAGISELMRLKIILPFSTQGALGHLWGFTDEGKMLLAEFSD